VSARAEVFPELASTHARHDDVGDDQVDACRPPSEHRECRFSIRCLDHLVSVACQDATDREADEDLVLYEQDRGLPRAA
jgi:hypothetical protein